MKSTAATSKTVASSGPSSARQGPLTSSKGSLETAGELSQQKLDIISEGHYPWTSVGCKIIFDKTPYIIFSKKLEGLNDFQTENM